jgi:vacuolar-type H+-ATPase subunit I/STV1
MARPDFSIRLGLVGHAQVIQGVESLLNVMKQIIEAIKTASTEAMNYTRVVTGHTVSVRQADNATQGLIDTVELHRAAAQLEQAQIEVNETQFRAMAVAAAQFAQSTGTDVTEAFQRLTNAVRTASEEGIREYGISLEGLSTRNQRQSHAISELTRRFGEQEVEIRHTAEAISRLENTWGTAWSEMVAAADRNSSAIRRILTRLNREIQEVTNALETQRRAAENMARMGDVERQQEIRQELAELGVTPHGEIPTADLQRTVGAFLSRAYHRAGRTVGATGRGDFMTVLEENFSALTGGYSPAEIAQIRRLTAELDRRVRHETAGIQAGVDPVRSAGTPRVRSADDSARREAEQAERARVEALDAGQLAERRRINEQNELRLESERQTREARERAAAAGQRARDERQRQEEQEERERERRLQEALTAKEQFESAVQEVEQQTLEERQRINERAEETREDEMAQAQRVADFRVASALKADQEMVESRRWATEQFLAMGEKEREDREKTIEDLETTGNALNKMGGIMENIGGVVTAVAGENSRATEVMSGVIGAFRIAENVVAAATEVAKAVAAAASQEYGSAALHGIAAALHIAAAAKAAAELGTGGKSTSGASTSAAGAGAGGGSFRPERQRPFDARNNPDRPIVVTINGPVTSRRVNDELDAMANDSDRRAA